MGLVHRLWEGGVSIQHHPVELVIFKCQVIRWSVVLEVEYVEDVTEVVKRLISWLFFAV